jgi:hypothetical protein
MSPRNARARTLYFLIIMNVVLAAFLVGGVVQVTILHDRVNTTQKRLDVTQRRVSVTQKRVDATQQRLDATEAHNYAGCLRGNVLREAARFALEKLGSPGRAAQPALRKQPCALIYPGGSP